MVHSLKKHYNMSREIEYSQEEIIKNISYFNSTEEKLSLERKELNKRILAIKKQKEFWLEFNKSQLKLF
jgi:hypothetical protein